MTTTDQVRAAATPFDALLILAAAVDELRAAKSQPDPWATWGKPASPLPPGVYGADVGRPIADRAPERDEALVAGLRELMQAATGDERRALEAQLRLAEDGGVIPGAYVTEGVTEAVTVTEDEILVELPPADPQRQAARRAWAQQVRLGTLCDPPMNEELAVETYVKGGPLWLYYGNRELACSFPIHMKQGFVSDVEADSPRTAQEIARDLLKADLDEARGDAPTGLDALDGDLA